MAEKYRNNNCEQQANSKVSDSQLKGLNCEQPKTALQGRICFLMKNGNCPRLEGEKLYPWGARIGLPRSTFHGVINGVQNMQRAVAERVSVNTGANIEWLISGVGDPFTTVAPVEARATVVNSEKATYNSKSAQGVLNIALLTKAIRTLEVALSETRRNMSPDQKAALIASIYELYSGSTHDDNTMQKTITQLIRSAA